MNAATANRPIDIGGVAMARIASLFVIGSPVAWKGEAPAEPTQTSRPAAPTIFKNLCVVTRIHARLFARIAIDLWDDQFHPNSAPREQSPPLRALRQNFELGTPHLLLTYPSPTAHQVLTNHSSTAPVERFPSKSKNATPPETMHCKILSTSRSSKMSAKVYRLTAAASPRSSPDQPVQ